jgi:hypothetical protein
MKQLKIVIGRLLALLSLLLFTACSNVYQGDPVVETIDYYPTLRRAVTCSDYGTSPAEPRDIKSVFSLSDPRVIVFCNFENLVIGETLISFAWYKPDGILFHKVETTSDWSSAWWCRWYTIAGSEQRWIDNPGQWRIEVGLDGKIAETLTFRVEIPY